MTIVLNGLSNAKANTELAEGLVKPIPSCSRSLDPELKVALEFVITIYNDGKKTFAPTMIYNNGVASIPAWLSEGTY